MKVLILFGSPRKKGNTASLLSPFMDELKKCGADVAYHDVYEKNIAGCRACLGCQHNKGEICCVVKDDMQPILTELKDTDLIVLAAPVYLWAAPAPVKAVMDRMVYSACKYYGNDPFGPALLQDKKLAILTTCGYPVEKAADLYEESVKRFAKHCKISYSGMLAERQRNLKEPFMNEEKEANARRFAAQLIGVPAE